MSAFSNEPLKDGNKSGFWKKGGGFPGRYPTGAAMVPTKSGNTPITFVVQGCYRFPGKLNRFITLHFYLLIYLLLRKVNEYCGKLEETFYNCLRKGIVLLFATILLIYFTIISNTELCCFSALNQCMVHNIHHFK